MNKFVLLTGASGGIGSAIAFKLAQQGYSLYLHYFQNEHAVMNLLAKLKPFGGEYIPIQADLSQKEGFELVVNEIHSLDAIVHNGGHSHYGLLTEITADELEALIQVHVTSPMLLTKKLLPKFTSKQKGRIVMISSIWGQTGAACEVAYSTVKGAQLAFVKALSKETARNGITVNAVAPGAIDTPMLNDFTSEEIEYLRGEIPVGRLGKAEEVADAVAFLIGDQASYITGQTIAVNGGWYV